MNKRKASIVAFVCGMSVLCLTLFGIYKDFFAPRLGPLGTGEYAWTVYATYTAGIISGVCYIVLGAVMYMKNSRVD